MSTYVLVHGAWRGGWIWKRVRRELQERGHEVFTPALTGVGERSHLLTPQVNLETHIADVINLIRWEQLSDVVLCGHSYGGCVVSGVGDRIPEKIGALVYLDAFVPEDGQVFTTRFRRKPATSSLKPQEKWETVGRCLRFLPRYSMSTPEIAIG